jgi:predicted  nucleic acid-binding Zn-ribbon protein
MAASNDLEARMTTLETQFQELAENFRHTKQDATAARVLASRANRDVTEIRTEIRDFRKATTASFNAMREDFTDLRTQVNNGFTEIRSEVCRGFAEVRSRFAEVDGKFAEVDNGFIAIRGKLAAAAAGQQEIVTLLNTLIGQQDGQATNQ